VDFVVLLYDVHGGLQSGGGSVAIDALQGSPVGGLDVAVDTAVDRPIYSLTVRIIEPCPSASSWLIARHAFVVRGAAEIQIVIGDAVALNWVSCTVYRSGLAVKPSFHYPR